jgi:TonB-linked SusC/RagA family outer membrane protein
MRKLIFMLAFLLLAGVHVVYAQTTISGTVTDDNGDPVPGANVRVKGYSDIGTITDLNGTYSLNVPVDATTLVYSFVGMAPKEVEIAGQTVLNVTLSSEDVGVEEVVVVAYGTAKKSTFTGAVGVVNAEDIEEVPVASIDMAIAGKTAGVQVGSGSGLPGSINSIRIRGVGSISSSNEPLYVIDGVPVINEDIGRLATSSISALATLSSGDIASITILKDAAAASLYGSRAANGVILITTKKGKAGKTNFKFKSSFGRSNFATDNAEWASVDEALEYQLLVYKNYALDAYPDITDAEADTYAQDAFAADYPDFDPDRPDSDYDWIGELFNTGSTQSHEFSASGGNEKTTFYTSLGYFDMTGMSGNYIKRYSGRVSIDHMANNVFSLGVNSAFSATYQETQPTNSWYYANPFYWKQVSGSQFYPIRNLDGTYNINLDGQPNLVRERELQEQGEDIYRSQNNLWLSANIIQGLQFKSVLGLDFIVGDTQRWWPSNSNDGAPNGYGSQQNTIRKILTSSNTLSYTKNIMDAHNISALIGYEIQSYRYDRTFTDGEDFPNDVLRDLDNAATALNTGTYFSEDKTISYLSKLDYDYKNKYYLSGSFRRDGSSRLGANKRWGNFWSVSAAWRAKEESFLQGISWLNDLKLRASYGVSGNLPEDRYGTLALYEYGANYNNNPGMYIDQAANPNLEWEKNYNYNIGLDARIFDFLSVEFEYYNRDTKDLLLEVPISPTTGLPDIWRNIGHMNNKGFEISVTSINFSKGDFFWSTNLNISTNKNKIVALNNHENIDDFPFILREGSSFNTFYLRDWAGVDPETGIGSWYMIEYEYDDAGNVVGEHRMDEDGDGEWDKTQNSAIALKKDVGTADPKFIGGLTNTFSYKGIDLSFLFTFKVGGKSYYDQASAAWHNGWYYSPVQKYVYDNTWRQPGDNAEFPKPHWYNGVNQHFNSSRRLHDASYIRLKNLSVGYTLPANITEKAKLGKVRFYFNAINLWTKAKFEFYDPEVSIRGIGLENADFPPLKTITFGLEVNF